MKTKKYVTYLFSANATGNKLQKSILEYVRSQDRKIIQIRHLKNYRTNFLEKIQELNNTHHRCTPYKPSWYNSNANYMGTANDDDDAYWSLHGIDFIRFAIFEVEEEI